MSDTIRALQILVMRSVNNGIVSYVLSTLSALEGRLQSDVVMLNEPDAATREQIEKLGGKLFVLKGRNRNPVRYMKELGGIIRDGSYEIVHAHGNSCTLLTEMTAAKNGGAAVRIPHAHNTDCKQKFLHAALRSFFDRSYTAAAACGTAAGRFLFGEKPFTVLKNGIDTERFRFDPVRREEKRKELGIGNRRAILHVGNFNDYKNQSFLIRPFSGCEGAVLLFAGEGEYLEAVQKQAAEAGLTGDRVRFLGKRSDVPDLLSAADLFVLPSLHEGFPISLVEAQASGLPCLCAETVTPDAAVTELVRYLPLEEEQWAAALAETEPQDGSCRAKAAEAVRLAGYDRKDTAEAFFEYYRSQIRSKN